MTWPEVAVLGIKVFGGLFLVYVFLQVVAVGWAMKKFSSEDKKFTKRY